MIHKTASLTIEGFQIIGRLSLPERKSPYPLVCICHGIPAGTPPVPGDGGYPLLAERICRQGCAVFIFNFRGTGESGGNIDLMGWNRDLGAVIDYLNDLPEIDKSNLILFGFSGGAAVSVCVAARDKRVSAVAACACPAEFSRLVRDEAPETYIDHFRAIGAIRDADFPSSTQEWIDGFNRVSPVDYVSEIAPRPLLLVHGSDDETVAISHAHRLYEKAGDPKQLIVLDNGGHKLRQDERVMTAFMDWLQSLS